MLITNAIIYRPDYKFQRGSIAVSRDRFATVPDPGEILDLQGKYLIPGLIDIHLHGCAGVDFASGGYAGLEHMARCLAQNGITSFSPATATLPENQLGEAYAAARKFRDNNPSDVSRIQGVTMEGPFFNPRKKGAQNPAYMVDSDLDLFLRLQQISNDMIRITCVAPELAGAMDYIKKAADYATVAVAHTTADYETARLAFINGATHVTHLFNAMPPLAHREPGVIGAAAENPAVTAELICDGIHVHPSAVRAAFKLFGAARMVLVSDSLSACGMPDGDYDLGGMQIRVQGRKATLADGTIAGSTTNLYDCLRKAIDFGINPEDAIRAATDNPARVIKAAASAGSTAIGKNADFLVCNPDWTLDSVYLGGKVVKPAN